jgi:hypothetical protein
MNNVKPVSTAGNIIQKHDHMVHDGQNVLLTKSSAESGVFR